MFKLEKTTEKAILTIYGYVGGYYMDFRAVNTALADIKSSGLKKLDFHLHTYGGSVIDGNLIYNFIKSFDGEVDIYIDGVAASMGSIIITAGTRVHIASNGFIMIHRPSGYAEGNADDMQQNAKLLRSMEKNFKEVLMKRTGKPEAEVAKWFSGSDFWFDADEAVALNLADDKFNGSTIETPLNKSEVAAMDAKAVYDRFAASLNILNNSINSQTSISDMDKKEVIARYGLTGVTTESTDEDIFKAIDAKMTEKENAAEQQLKSAIETVVDNAVTAKKITAEKRQSYIEKGLKLGVAELNSIFSDMNPYQSISNAIKTEGNSTQNENGKDNWTWKDYQNNAVAELEEMPKKNPDKFKALYKKEFGVEPTI